MRGRWYLLIGMNLCCLSLWLGVQSTHAGSDPKKADKLPTTGKDDTKKPEQTKVPPTKKGEVEDKEVGKLKLELAAAQKALADLKQALAKSQKDQEAAQAKLIETSKLAETLRKKLDSQSAQVKAAAEVELALKEAVRKRTLADEQVAAIRKELATQQKKMADLQGMADRLRKDLDTGKTQYKTALAKLETAVNDANQTQLDLSAAKLALAKKETQLAETLKLRETLSKQYEAEKAQLKAANAKLDLITKEATSTKADLQAAQKKLNDTKLNLEQTQAELAVTQKNLIEHQASAEKLRSGFEAEKAQLKQVQGRLEAARKEMMRTKADLEDARSVLAKLPPQTALIVVQVPEDARLSFNQYKTYSMGPRRFFASPALPLGETFYYTVKAEFQRDGKTVTLEKRVEFRAGDQAEVNFQPVEPPPSASGTKRKQ